MKSAENLPRSVILAGVSGWCAVKPFVQAAISPSMLPAAAQGTSAVRKKPTPAARARAAIWKRSFTSVELGEFFLHDLRQQRHEHALGGDHILALFAQHGLEEFLDLRLELRARRPVDVDINIAAERIGVVIDRVDRRRDERVAVLFREWHDADVVRDIRQQRIGDATEL